MDENETISNLPQYSPRPRVFSTVVDGEVDFYDALRAVRKGMKATRTEWDDQFTYLEMADGFLHIHLSSDNLLHPLKVGQGDIDGMDWVVF